MKRRSLITILALAALLAFSISPGAIAAWYCKGRACGTTPLRCCCENPDDARDPDCSEPARADATCLTGCGCVLVAAPDTPYSWSTPGSSFSAPLLAALPLRFSDLLLITPEPLVYTVVTRGPPPAVRVLLPCGLRAPPAA